jgi:hypothetical protein
LFWFLGVYTRVSVYRDWINYTISINTRDDDIQLLNMPNNIDMSNNLEIWWDTENTNRSGDNLILRIDLLFFCFFVIIKIKYQ